MITDKQSHTVIETHSYIRRNNFYNGMQMKNSPCNAKRIQYFIFVTNFILHRVIPLHFMFHSILKSILISSFHVEILQRIWPSAQVGFWNTGGGWRVEENPNRLNLVRNTCISRINYWDDQGDVDTLLE